MISTKQSNWTMLVKNKCQGDIRVSIKLKDNKPILAVFFSVDFKTKYKIHVGDRVDIKFDSNLTQIGIKKLSTKEGRKISGSDQVQIVNVDRLLDTVHLDTVVYFNCIEQLIDGTCLFSRVVI